MHQDDIILVNELDEQTGTSSKTLVHEKGWLHRAFSVFVFDKEGRMLLQRRAEGKYHCGGLWTNTCCSHPKPGELTEAAAHRRLKEEMGFDTDLEEIFHFVYQAPFDNGLTEYEFDHVFAGEFDGRIEPDPNEVSEYRYLHLYKIAQMVKQNPEAFTPWFLLALPRVEEWWNKRYQRLLA